METIYLLIGEKGEYEDCRTWVVCAYRDTAPARQHLLLAQAFADSISEARRDTEVYCGRPDAYAEASPYDEHFQSYCYAETATYTIESVALWDKAPTLIDALTDNHQSAMIKASGIFRP